ncbi:MAG: hypothetical protein K8R46_06455 [Pirellulales bacterium]|nr:hypothetical protein [Pirellulales bacterium]
MPSKHHKSNDIIESQLTDRLLAIEETLDCDALAFVGPIINPLADDIREAVEDISGKRDKLAVVLETDGGYIDSARRIAETLRYHYQHIDFVIPNHAMSAGTVLAMSGDNILMDYYSVLGPIDPQIPREKGEGLVPALGYLLQFERLVEKSKKGQLSDAELAFLLNRFDPGELYQYGQERELSTDLLTEWLVRFKFKDWTVTETQQHPVTPEMRQARAEEIARSLNDPSRWHSHGRGITMSILRNDLKLKIGDFGENRNLNDAVRGYYKLLKDYMEKRNYDITVHAKHQFLGW